MARTEERPRVAVVRVADRADAVMADLRARGGDPVLVPALDVAPPEDDAELRACASRLASYDAVVLGSIAGAEALVARADPAAPFEGPVFCVGAQTRRRLDADPRLARVLSGPRIVPADARAEGLEEAIRMNLSPLAGKRFLFPRPPEGRLLLVERLEASRAHVDAPDAYRIVAGEPLSPRLLADLEQVSAFLFFSGEAVRGFLEVAPEDWARRRLETAWVGIIGPAGAERARALGVRVDAVPASVSTRALVELWGEHVAASRGAGS